MSDIEGVQDVAVDTTARAFFRSSRKAKALQADVKTALKDAKLKLKEFGASKLAKPSEVYYIEVKGLG